MLRLRWLTTYLVVCTLISSNLAIAASGAGLTYHGRLVGPDGTPVTSTNVQFRLQVKTSGSENCLLFEEIQSKDLTNSNGVFAITINDGSGARQDSNTYSIDQIFANRGGFSFPAGYCTSGSTYSPNPSDGRMLQVYFNDGSFSGWEPVPSQSINFVPMAIEAMQVAGYKKEQLLKVGTGVDTTGYDLNAVGFAELIALITGTSTQFVKPGAATFTAAPQWAGTPSAANDLANKSYVDAQIAAGLPNVGTAGTYTKVTTDSKGRVTTGTSLAAADIPAIDASKITSGVLPIANGGTNSSTALVGSKVMVSSASAIVEGMASNTAKSNNTFVMRDGSGNIAGALGTFDGLSVLLGGSLTLNGATSGFVSLAAPTTVTSYTMTLPTTAGSTGQVLTTNGSGVLSWSSPSSGLPAAAGTAAAPGYAFSGNTNTGLFSPAANMVALSTNGTERLRVDDSGNVGVGTATPSYPLTVKAPAGNNSPFWVMNSSGSPLLSTTQNTSTYPFFGVNTSTAGYAAFGILANSATYTAMQNAATTYLQGDTGGHVISVIKNNYWSNPTEVEVAAGVGYAYIGTATNSDIYIRTNNSNKMVISASGNVGIGTVSPTSKLEVAGDIKLSSGADRIIGVTDTTTSGVMANSITISGGYNSGGGNAQGGAVLIKGGNAQGASYGGDINISSGNSSSAAGSHPGSISISPGVNTSAGMAGGAAVIKGGDNLTGPGGQVILAGGDSGIAGNYNGGSVLISGGAPTGTGLRGNVTIASSGGNVGIGTSSPTAKLDVSGQIVSRPYNNGAATTFDMNNGNAQYTTASCAAMTLNNMVDGGSYTIAVQGATSGTCTFTDVAGGRTFRFSPANGATTASTHTLYSMQVMGSYVYVSWISGF